MCFFKYKISKTSWWLTWTWWFEVFGRRNLPLTKRKCAPVVVGRKRLSDSALEIYLEMTGFITLPAVCSWMRFGDVQEPQFPTGQKSSTEELIQPFKPDVWCLNVLCVCLRFFFWAPLNGGKKTSLLKSEWSNFEVWREGFTLQWQIIRPSRFRKSRDSWFLIFCSSSWGRLEVFANLKFRPSRNQVPKNWSNHLNPSPYAHLVCGESVSSERLVATWEIAWFDIFIRVWTAGKIRSFLGKGQWASVHQWVCNTHAERRLWSPLISYCEVIWARIRKISGQTFPTHFSDRQKKHGNRALGSHEPKSVSSVENSWRKRIEIRKAALELFFHNVIHGISFVNQLSHFCRNFENGSVIATASPMHTLCMNGAHSTAKKLGGYDGLTQNAIGMRIFGSWVVSLSV